MGARLNTIHNLRYYQRLMAEIREAVANKRYEAFVTEFYQRIGKTPAPLGNQTKQS